MSMFDDEAGYAYDDPKHPSWADRVFEAADRLRDREREQLLSNPSVADGEEDDAA